MTKEECRNCHHKGDSETEDWWDFDDQSTLCNECYKKIGRKWERTADKPKRAPLLNFFREYWWGFALALGFILFVSSSNLVSSTLGIIMFMAGGAGLCVWEWKRPKKIVVQKKVSPQERSSKYRALLLNQINEDEIIDEEMGNNRYVALTKDTLYFVTIGVSSGTFFGKKIKSYPVEDITSVDVSKKIMVSYMEVTAAGMGGSNDAGAAYMANNENIVAFPNYKLPRFQEIAEKIRSLKRKSKEGAHESSVDQIKKLHNLLKEGIITKEEFEKKKKKLLK